MEVMSDTFWLWAYLDYKFVLDVALRRKVPPPGFEPCPLKL